MGTLSRDSIVLEENVTTDGQISTSGGMLGRIMWESKLCLHGMAWYGMGQGTFVDAYHFASQCWARGSHV